MLLTAILSNFGESQEKKQITNYMKHIALIAHDGKKAELINFILQNQQYLQNSKLYATGTTGTHIEEAGFEVTKFLSGPYGGDAQIAAKVATKELDMVFFFRDALGKHPHEPDVQMLMRQCDIHNVPLATNMASAKLLILGMNTQEAE